MICQDRLGINTQTRKLKNARGGCVTQPRDDLYGECVVHHGKRLRAQGRWCGENNNSLFGAILTLQENDEFTKTGSGQT